MGVSGDVSFRNVRVVPSANDTVADLDALPPEGTAEEHMNLQGAERLKNSYREQICLNGLWRFFPIQGEKTTNDIPVKGSGWCWFKIPGAWPCPRGENFAGNSQAIIASPFAPEIDQLKLNEAWYRREFEIPEEWSGRRIVLNFTMLQYIKQDPESGHVFAFFSRNKKQVKLLQWEDGGFVIWMKRLEQGGFHIPQSVNGRIELSARELSAILSGIKPQRYYKRYSKKS